jgi:predicted transcriptional regulator
MTSVIVRESVVADGADDPGERISEAEHAVMEALWRNSPLTAAEVSDRVAPERGWSLATVKTLLSRLVAKKVVVTEPDGRRYLYSPTIERTDYVGIESRLLVDRLFDGRAAPLLAHLVESEALSDEDIAEIERLIRELKT